MDSVTVEKELCPNCKKEIPQVNYVMHTAHCARHLAVCPTCKEAVPKAQLAAHSARHEVVPQVQPLKKASTSTTWRSLPQPVYVPERLGAARPPKDMKACTFCSLELPGDTLREHEEYCGARTDRCNVCGELVMFRYRQLHEETNHGFLKLSDEPGPKASWDSSSERAKAAPASSARPPSAFDMTAVRHHLVDGADGSQPKRIDYKDLSRRLDCKTEYIRNVLHDAASITAPLRSSPTAPRNHYAHRRNPPTTLTIPCEFCATPIPHEELIQHETGCRPDLVRFNPRRRRAVDEEDDEPMGAAAAPEIELPCEFCNHLIPASQLLRHQAACT